MDVEVIAHGEMLSGGFLDDLFVSIRDKIPCKKWIHIQKNRVQATAGIKYLIDMDFYGEPMEIVFNSEYTHFKKRTEVVRKPHPFKDLYVDGTAWARRYALDEAEVCAHVKAVKRERRKQELESKPKIRKRGRKR